jgi:hypothetical protein
MACCQNKKKGINMTAPFKIRLSDKSRGMLGELSGATRYCRSSETESSKMVYLKGAEHAAGNFYWFSYNVPEEIAGIFSSKISNQPSKHVSIHA